MTKTAAKASTPTSTRKSTPKSHNPRKTPRDPRWTRQPLSVEELGVYTSSHQIDPWRGQLVQIGWDYCV